MLLYIRNSCHYLILNAILISLFVLYKDKDKTEAFMFCICKDFLFK
jgi:hypothetical protein